MFNQRDENVLLSSWNFINQKEYWTGKLSGELEKSKLLVSDSVTSTGVAIDSVPIYIPPRLNASITRLANQSDLTLYIILLTGLNVLHYLYSQDSDTVILSPVFQPNASRETINDRVYIRNNITPELSFKQLLIQVRQSVLEAYENQDYPSGKLLEFLMGATDHDENAGQLTLSDIMCALDIIHHTGDIEYNPETLFFKFKLSDGDADGEILFHPGLYDRFYVEQAARHYIHIMEAALGNIDITLDEISLLSPEEKQHLTQNLIRGTADTAFPLERTVHGLIEEQAKAHPHRLAVKYKNHHLSYGRLWEQSGRLALHLQSMGIAPGSIIGLLTGRSSEMLIAILGILRAGCAYMPIDPAYPLERIQGMISDAQIPLLICRNRLVADMDLPDMVRNMSCDLLDIHEFLHQPLSFSPKSPPPLNADTGSRSLAYVIFTSGSTGKPNGVLIEHRALINFIYSIYTSFEGRVHENDRCLSLTNTCFDVSVCELFLPLMFGASLLVMADQDIYDLKEMADTIVNEAVSFAYIPPSLLAEVRSTLASSGTAIALDKMLVGVEPIRDTVLSGYIQLNPSMRIINGYGPTEATICSTFYPFPRDIAPQGKNVPIGRPLHNTAIYILTPNHTTVPTGIAGELCIAGTGLARGYLNNPELTASRFVNYQSPSIPPSSPFAVYKTGDLARWLHDGNIQFLGRIDHQVKIRGYRIEPGEIESRLTGHPSVKEAVVIPRHIGTGDEKILCAYIVPQNGKDMDENILKEHLSLRLPDFMIPSYFIRMEGIPLTPSCKIDRRALPEPQISSTKEYVPPTGETQQKLAQIWADVLGIDREKIGALDNFFELGGHSLKSTILISRIHKALNVRVPLQEIFNSPTLAELADAIENSVETKYSAVKPAEKKEYYPLSPAQKRLYLLQAMEPGGTGYNIPFAISLPENAGLKLIENTIRKLIQRHQSLRTSFHLIDGQPVQIIHETVSFSLENIGPVGPGEPIPPSGPFDLTQAPLIRAATFQLTPTQTSLFIDMHHIITDGASHTILEREFKHLYDGKTLPPLKLQYKDYSQWLHRDEQQQALSAQRDYWTRCFGNDVPVLELPYDFPRPPIQEFKGKLVNFILDDQTTAALKELANQMDGTLFMVLMAVWNILLSRLSGQSEIITGVPIAARRHADLELIIGMFVNTIAIRQNPAGDKKLPQFLQEVKAKMVRGFENQEYPFEDLVENLSLRRDTSRNPLFDVFFNLLNQRDYSGELPDLDIGTQESFGHRDGASKFDLSFTAVDFGAFLYFTVEYDIALFLPQTIERYISYFKCLAQSVASGSGASLALLDMIPGTERKQLLEQFNHTSLAYPSDKTIHALIHDQAVKTPAQPAVIFDDDSLTYRRLDEKSTRLATALVKRYSIGEGDIIAFSLPRSIDVPIVIIAILKTGGLCLPIDPEYPEDRIQYILKDSNAALFITENILSKAGEYSSATEDSAAGAAPAHGAYIIYTSGSMGRPKGVMLHHRGIINHAYTKIEELHIDSADIMCQNLNIGFVASIWQFFAPLFCGCRLFIYPETILADPAAFFKRVQDDRLTVVEVVPSLLKTYLEMLETGAAMLEFPDLRLLVLTGERILPGIVTRFYTLYGNSIGLVNAYGQSECSDDTLHYHIPTPSLEQPLIDPIPIGKPSANTRVFVLGPNYELQPIGIPGELFITGDGLAFGYLNRPELTGQRFLTELPLLTGPSESLTLFRTGDRVRWLQDGNIQFLGRVDHQVKIRGFRIEPGEIENRLLEYPPVWRAVVIERFNSRGENYLCAYVVAKENESIESAAIRDFLQQRLPDYMVPTYFVMLDRIPLNASGKIDRMALPEPGEAVDDDYQPPSGEIEEQLADIWSHLLDIPRENISRRANFFQSGGHSLKAIILIASIHKHFGVELDLKQVFHRQSLTAMAKAINDAPGSPYGHIPSAPEKEYYPLSSAQKRLYILHRLEENGTGYNLPQAVALAGKLDIEQLNRSFKDLIKRHEILRTSFLMLDDEPVQRIHDTVEFNLERRQSEPGWPPDFVRPFDLSIAPLMRACLVELGTEKHVLLTDMHHIITDATSRLIFTQELSALYNGKSLDSPGLRYIDYAEWQNRPENKTHLAKQESFWLKQLEGDIPVLTLPYDFDRPLLQSFEGSIESSRLDSSLTRQLKQMAHDSGGTLYMVILALYNILLSRLSGQQDIIIGTPVAGRRHHALQKVMGVFINTLALRNFPLHSLSFNSFLNEINRRTLEAFENQDYQFEDLVDRMVVSRDTSRNPLFDASLIFQNADIKATSPDSAGPDMPGLHMRPYSGESRTSRFDLTLVVQETGDELALTFEYCSRLFLPQTIRRFVNYFKRIATAVAHQPGSALAEIEILDDSEKQRLLYQFNDTEVDYPRGLTVHQLFSQRAAQCSDHIAICHGNNNSRGSYKSYMTYRRLDQLSDLTASALMEKGVASGSIAAIMVERNADMLASILGVLKAGAAYLPIGPEYPPERVDYMLKDSAASIIISNSGMTLQSGQNIERLNIDTFYGQSLSPSISNLNIEYSPADMAYVIYTSGSTGLPKGVVIEHRPLVNFFKGIHDLIPFHPDTAILSLTTISFDIFGLETLLPLTRGCKVVIGGQEEQNDGEAAAAISIEENISLLQVTPSRLQVLLADPAASGGLSRLDYLLVGGEAFPLSLLEKAGKITSARIFNLYGPTETTIWSCVRQLTGKSRVDIGKPIANTQIYILGPGNTLQPRGVPGELCIAGDGLARGYLNRPELTASRFITLNHSPFSNHLIYRTGDLARWLPDGNIGFSGRLDHQLKIRGYRIEPGEIESVLDRFDSIKESVVMVRQRPSGDKYLCAYYLGETGDEKDLSYQSLRQFLSQSLPDYMIPAHFMKLERFPLNASGKIDRKALPEPLIQADDFYTAPRDKTEEILVATWAQILELEPDVIGIDTSFFQLGGHSLKAIIMISRIHKILKVKISLAQLFDKPTIRDLARFIKGSGEEAFEAIDAVEKREYYPLSSAQMRLYIEFRKGADDITYNIPIVRTISRDIDKDKLEQAITLLIQRHESLRTSFHLVDGEPVQRIHDAGEVPFKLEPLHTAENQDVDNLIENFIRPFDLSRPPLFRVGLIDPAKSAKMLVIDIHHIITDGISQNILERELLSIYSGNRPQPLRIQYKDFSIWQHRLEQSGEMKKQREFWLNQFNEDIPVLELPLSFERPAKLHYIGHSLRFNVDDKHTALLKELAVEEGVTLFMVLLALYYTLLHKLTRQQDIVVGTAISGRRHEDLEPVIGFFVNTLALRNYPAPRKTFRQFLNEVRACTLEAFENRDFQLEDLVEQLDIPRNPNRNPLFDVMFALQNFNEEIDDLPDFDENSDAQKTPFKFARTSKFDLLMIIMETKSALHFTLEYNSELFTREALIRFVRYFRDILSAVCGNPDISLEDIDISHEYFDQQLQTPDIDFDF